MDSQDMFADVDVADTQVSQQSKKRKRAECRVRQINVQWSTETVMSLIVEVYSTCTDSQKKKQHLFFKTTSIHQNNIYSTRQHAFFFILLHSSFKMTT